MSSPRSIEEQYRDAVLAGDFARATAAFAELPWKAARVPLRDEASIQLELRRSKIDAVLGAFEAPRGAWRAIRGGSTLLYGFDEWVAIRPDLRDDERSLLAKHGLS